MFGAGHHLKKVIGERDQLARTIKAMQASLKEQDEAILRLCARDAEAGFTKADKPSGTIHFNLDGEVFTADIDKRVKWDSDALQRIAGSISFEEALSLFKVEYSVPEKVFNDLADGDLKQRLTDARTVTYSQPKITMKQEK